MRIKPIGDNPSKEKKQLPNGNVIVKDYIVYDRIQEGYINSTKLWASHYIQYTYDSDGNLINKEIKNNPEGQKTSDAIHKALKKFPL